MTDNGVNRDRGAPPMASAPSLRHLSEVPDLDFMVGCARRAAKAAILPRFQSLSGLASTRKSRSDDIVTIADQDAEKMITAEVRSRWPDSCVIGEESVSDGVASVSDIVRAARTFVIDPLDGTWNFANGLPLFGVVLALVEHGKTVAGVLYDPVTDDAVLAAMGTGAYFCATDGTLRLLRASAPRNVPDMIGFSGHGLLDKAVQRRLAEPLTHFHRVLSLRCSCHEYRMLAAGHAQFVIGGNLNPWDHLAGALVVTEAGGHAALHTGAAYGPDCTKGILVAASSFQTWKDVADVIADPLTDRLDSRVG